MYGFYTHGPETMVCQHVADWSRQVLTYLDNLTQRGVPRERLAGWRDRFSSLEAEAFALLNPWQWGVQGMGAVGRLLEKAHGALADLTRALKELLGGRSAEPAPAAGGDGPVGTQDGEAAQGAGELVLREGESVLSEAESVLSEGEVVLSESEVVLSEGEVVLSEGEVVLSEGEVVLSEGEVVLSEGESVLSEGEVVPSEGEVVLSEGGVVLSEGEVVLSEGEVVPSEGEVVPSEGEVVPSEGELARSDGPVHRRPVDRGPLVRPEIRPVPIGGHPLPPLPYPYDALEPYIDQRTMRLHHDRHHRSYVEGLNKAERMMAEARRSGDFDLITHWEREAAFNGAGHYLHTLFWTIMAPGAGGRPTGPVAQQIDRDFGSFEQFKTHFSRAAEKVEGPGWALWVWSPRANRTEILTAEKHQNLTQWESIPLLVLDVWEHAHYLKYPNDRKAYIEAWWNVVNWPEVARRYERARTLTWEPA